MTVKPTGTNRIERQKRLQWVPLALMRVSPLAQRKMNYAWVSELASDFDIEKMNTPTINKRDSHFYVMDGQHTCEALRRIGYGDQQIQCWVYEGLTEQQEAQMFLILNRKKATPAFENFRIAVQAGWPQEVDIDRIVRDAGCVVSQDKSIDGAISAVGVLGNIYKRSGPEVLARAIRLARDAYGTVGLEHAILDGIGLLCGRYNGELQDQVAVARLSNIHAGANGLLNKAEVIRRATGIGKAHAVAAAAVEVINAGKGGKKLASWFREDAA